MVTPVLVPSDPLDRERILVFGAAGVGKTTGYLSILSRVAGRGFVIDTDATMIRSTSSEQYRPLREKLAVCEPQDLREAIEAVDGWRKEATNEDWFVIDRADWLWDAAQQEFSNEVFGKDADEHFLNFRAAAQAAKDSGGKGIGNPFDGMADWPTIKKRYGRMARAIMTWPGHVYVATAEKELIQGMESNETQREYGRIGAKPSGEKHLSHLTHTVLRLQGNSPTTWRATTVKDRERKQFDGTGIGDFATDYLQNVAGWQVEIR